MDARTIVPGYGSLFFFAAATIILLHLPADRKIAVFGLFFYFYFAIMDAVPSSNLIKMKKVALSLGRPFCYCFLCFSFLSSFSFFFFFFCKLFSSISYTLFPFTTSCPIFSPPSLLHSMNIFAYTFI